MNEGAQAELEYMFHAYYWDMHPAAAIEKSCDFSDKSEVFTRADLLAAFKAGRESV